jgi:transposase
MGSQAHDLQKGAPSMNTEKYIGLDVHQATISVAVLDGKGKVVMESILETKAATILEFLAGLRGTLSVTFEEGTWAAWLYDLLKPRVAKLVVCNPRKNALLKHGNKNDRIDARKLANLLRLNELEPVYHGETGVRMLRELARSYLTIVKDLTRVMNRLKAAYRSWAIPCAGRDVYYTRHRAEWLSKIREAGVRRRAERLYQQLDMLQHLRQQARQELLAESRKHVITAKLRQIPSFGPIRAALAVALIQTPHRFRTKRQLWAYSGLALETRTSGEHCYVHGQLQRSKKQITIRGLNRDHNHDLKGLFKGAATRASVCPGPFQDFYQRSLAKGIKPTMVRLTLARKIAAITLTLWKKGENFDAKKLTLRAA